MATKVATAGRSPLPFRTVDYQRGAWNDYVESHGKGTVFHLSELLDAFSNTPLHDVYARAAIDEDARIVALVAAVRVATLPGLVGRISSRSIYFAAPLCNATDEGADALVQLIAEHDAKFSPRTLFAEVRNVQPATHEREPLESCGYAFTDYLNYIVNTSQDADLLWRRLSKSARKNIRRSKRRGVEIELDTTHDGVERMYELVKSSYARSRVPVADIALFHEAIDRLPDSMVQIRLATHQGNDVAGGIGLIYGSRFYAWYGGCIRQRGIQPFDCLTWDEMQWCAQNGIGLYDFGGAGWPNEEYGPRDFKAKFGGDLVRYGRYRKVFQKYTFPFAKTAYRVIRHIVKI